MMLEQKPVMFSGYELYTSVFAKLFSNIQLNKKKNLDTSRISDAIYNLHLSYLQFQQSITSTSFSVIAFCSIFDNDYSNDKDIQ